LTGNISDLPQVSQESKFLLDLGWVGTSLLKRKSSQHLANGC
jgi:hypothetical protein